jgi:YegS/Rv2252/BmrU family lipid kinase
MTLPPQDGSGCQQREPHTHRRCLILANARAGIIRSLRERLADLMRQGWNRLRGESSLACGSPPGYMPFLAETATGSGIEACVEAVPLPHQLPARVRAAEQEGFDTVVAAGGDGTVHSVAQAMVHSSLCMGIIPMGTANNVARVLGLPLEVGMAMQVIATGQERRIDIGRVAGRFFLEAAGVGIFADTFVAFGKEEPRKYQIFRLLRILGPMFWNPPVRNLQLTLDGVAEKEQAIWIAVSNSAYIGDNIELAPGANLEDGQFDVIIVGAMNRRELLEFAIALYHGKHLDLPKVRRVCARTVEIRRIHRSHRPLPVHADAEIVAYTPTRMEVVPGALRVLIPRSHLV